MEQYAVGIDLGGTMIKAALVGRARGKVHELSIATEASRGPEHVLDRIAEIVKEAGAFVPEGRISGVGIGAPGAINWERTSVIYPANLPGWKTVNLCDAVQKRIGESLPVFVENDANLAALGSAHYGAGKPYNSFIMVTLGTGVGGAIIYGNRIFRGSTGAAGEIGHMSVDYEGPSDRYGIMGAIEAYIGQRYLSHHARYRLMAERDSLVHEMAGEDLADLTPLMLYEAADRGDRHAREVLAWAGHKLGWVLGSCVNLLDIRTIIVGGGVSAAGRYILDPARDSLRRSVMPASREGLMLMQETLGNEAGMLGAAHLVFEFLDDQASPLPSVPLSGIAAATARSV